MRNTASKGLVAGFAALLLAAAPIIATIEPASAAYWHGRGGWHGGGWHGGGWRGGGRWLGPAIVGGLAAGALLAAPYYGYGYGSCYAYQPTYDAYGNYLGQQQVRVC